MNYIIIFMKAARPVTAANIDYYFWTALAINR